MGRYLHSSGLPRSLRKLNCSVFLGCGNLRLPKRELANSELRVLRGAWVERNLRGRVLLVWGVPSSRACSRGGSGPGIVSGAGLVRRMVMVSAAVLVGGDNCGSYSGNKGLHRFNLKFKPN